VSEFRDTFVISELLIANKGFWAELLGVGDFYFELGVQIVEICIATRNQNGGFLDLTELKRLLDQRRRNQKNAVDISEDDISRSIKNLRVLGSGFALVSVGKRKLVQSVPRELSVDHSAVMDLAQTSGYVTKEMMKQNLKWDADRIQSALNQLMKDGICWIDTQATPEQYWISSFWLQAQGSGQ
jgi:ESCRT-II complex subunit VPS22